MKPLILTGWPMPDFVKYGSRRHRARLAFFRFVWGPQPSPDELASYLGPRSPDQQRGAHWSDWVGYWNQQRKQKHRRISAWPSSASSTKPSNCGSTCVRTRNCNWSGCSITSALIPKTVARLKLRVVDHEMIGLDPDSLSKWRPPLVDVIEKELATASAAWQAYRSPTPEACFDLLRQDLSALPLLKPVLRDLLEELPSVSTGLGATEMRMLELIASGYANVESALPLPRAFARRASSARRNSAICLTGLRSARARRSQDSTRNCARSSGTICGAVHETYAAKPAVADRIRQGRSSRTRKTSAGTTRSIAGGAART